MKIRFFEFFADISADPERSRFSGEATVSRTESGTAFQKAGRAERFLLLRAGNAYGIIDVAIRRAGDRHAPALSCPSGP